MHLACLSGDHAAVGWAATLTQPYVPQTATLVPKAATLRAPGCNPMCRRLQPYVPQVGTLLAAAADLTARNADGHTACTATPSPSP